MEFKISFKGYSMVVDQSSTNLWDGYWADAFRLAPELGMKKPKGNTADSTFIQFCPSNFPKGMTIVHKLSRHSVGYVDVHFGRWGQRVAELESRTHDFRDWGMSVHRAKGSAAVRMVVPKISVSQPADSQREAIETGIRASARMLFWVRQHQSRIEEILKTPPSTFTSSLE